MKYRIVRLDNWAVPFYVPAYVVRIDIEKDGGVGSHGWQVRYHLAPSKFFSDSKYNKETKSLPDPYQSLNAAISYLKEHYKGPKPRLRDPKPKLIWLKQKNKNIKQAFITLPHPKPKVTGVKVYVGTENTFSDTRLISATEKALKLRKQLVDQHLLELQA